MGDGLELLERCYASGLGFHEGDLKVAVENRDDPTWYRNVQRASPPTRGGESMRKVKPENTTNENQEQG